MGWPYNYINHVISSSFGCAYLSDGVFVWNEDLTYYVRQYNFRLPRKFLEHMTIKNYIIDDIDVQKTRKRAFGF